MICFYVVSTILALVSLPFSSSAQEKTEKAKNKPIWPQWRGPNWDSQLIAAKWPDRVSQNSLKLLWRVPLGTSYSGPLVAENVVFRLATKNKESEIVYAHCWKSSQE
jgi:outer membrane protein assembly factor BamB